MIERDEVVDRLRDGNRGLQISSDSRSDHVDAMEELLTSFKTTNTPEQSRRISVPTPLRNAAILLVAFWLGIAAAAYSDRVPGDSFYRAKLAAEQPAQIVDRDLVVNNRLGELEALIERGAEPRTVLTARSSAARALIGQSDEDLERALSLLAWPGGLDGRGVDADATNGGLLIAESDWFNQRGYTASLADGHLVTISALDGEILIGTTGDWTVLTTGSGWQLTNDGFSQLYFIERQGRDLRVTSIAESPGSTAEEAAQPAEGPTGNTQSESMGDLTLESVSPTARSAGTTDTTTTVQENSNQTTFIPAGGAPAGTGPPLTTRSTSAPAAPGTFGTAPPTTTKAPAPAPTPAPIPATTAVTSTTVVSNSVPTTTIAPATTAAPGPVTTATTVAATTTTAAQTTTTVAPVVAWKFYLQNAGDGDTSSSRNLPLAVGSAPGGALSNFDTNRDDGPGLLIQKDGAGLSVSDSTKKQEWTWNATDATSFGGSAQLTIWLAAKDFKTDERIGLLASLELCNPGCSRLGTAQWSGSGSNNFRQATLSFGSVSTQVAAGSTLRLKVVVPDGLATTDVWFAYDTASQPSRVIIG